MTSWPIQAAAASRNCWRVAFWSILSPSLTISLPAGVVTVSSGINIFAILPPASLTVTAMVAFLAPTTALSTVNPSCRAAVNSPTAVAPCSTLVAVPSIMISTGSAAGLNTTAAIITPPLPTETARPAFSAI